MTHNSKNVQQEQPVKPDLAHQAATAAEAEQLLEGTIVKGFSGFYYVACNDVLYECSLRGKNRQKKVKFLPGDRVQFSVAHGETGAIETVLPRKNELLRPPVANLDQLIILAALADPLPDLRLIDRLTVFSQWNEITPIICFNKCDLGTEAEQARLQAIYQPAGFEVLLCSTVTGEGVHPLKALLQGKFSVFAGNSGVGKSSMMNAISDDWQLITGEISEKLKRGRHTTRHVELFQLNGNTLIADTPGFSSLQLPEDIKREELCKLFPEFLPYLEDCRFATCLHNNEPNCAIKEAVAQGKIAQSRYAHYLAFLEEVILEERNY